MKYCPNCSSALVKKKIDGVQRFFCSEESCGFVQWNNPTPVVAALVSHEGQMILARNARWPQGIFSVITGYLEMGEEPHKAVNREVEEELGLTATETEFIGHYMFKEKNQLIIAYLVVAAGAIELNHELAEYKKVSEDSLQHYDFNPLYITKAIVEDWLKLRGLS